MKHFIIPIFIPHLGCPHQCVFCNQQKITGVHTDIVPAEVAHIIDSYLADITQDYFIEAAFYGGSFTALPEKVQKALLGPASERMAAGRIDAIRLSTRPDCINKENLSLLYDMGVRTIELGVQSFSEEVLSLSERGHVQADIYKAVALIRSQGRFSLGLQLMPGLPGDDMLQWQDTIERTIALKPDMARIYPTIILQGTKLADMYEAGLYKPLSLQGAIKAAALGKILFSQVGIKVIRTGLQSSLELDSGKAVLAGPYHPAFGEMVENYIYNLYVDAVLSKLPNCHEEVVIHHAAVDTSRLRGWKNSNIRLWQQRYPHLHILFCQDAITAGAMEIEHQGLRYFMDEALLNL